MSTRPIAILAAKRTPVGSFQGVLQGAHAPDLGAAAIREAVSASKIDPALIREAILGCVLSAGVGQAPARQAVLKAGLPEAIHCMTINKVCGSGMKSVLLAHDLLLIDPKGAILAGGMESMTNAPYLLDRARMGYRFGHGAILDHILMDGLEDAYDKGTAMGVFAEATAKKYKFSREDQDAFAIESGKRAQKAVSDGIFKEEIATVTIKGRKGPVSIEEDESPSKVLFDKIPQLKPAFDKDGTVTAANASSLNDGAAALVLMHADQAEKKNLTPLALIHGHASHSHEPKWFTLAPIDAIKKLSQKLDWPLESVDLFEINEAFAVVTMAAMKDLNLPHEKVNIHGGACAMGHPIGASGARILVTLIHALKKRNLKRGIASLCIGGGEAVAIGVEIA